MKDIYILVLIWGHVSSETVNLQSSPVGRKGFLNYLFEILINNGFASSAHCGTFTALEK